MYNAMSSSYMLLNMHLLFVVSDCCHSMSVADMQSIEKTMQRSMFALNPVIK